MGGTGTPSDPGRQITADPVAVERLVRTLRTRRPRAQLVIGPIGVGKSALLSAVADALGDAGHPILPIMGMPGLESNTHGALLPLLAAVAPSAATAEAGLQRLFAMSAPAGARQVLVVGAADHLDPASAAVVSQLVRTYGLRALISARSPLGLPEAITRLIAEGLVETTGLDWPADPGDDVVERTSPLVAAAVSALDEREQRVLELVAVAGFLPEDLLDAPAEIGALERAGLIVRPVSGAISLPHATFAGSIFAELPRSAIDARRAEFDALLSRLDDDLRLEAAVRLMGDHRAVELRAPATAVALGSAALRRISDPDARARLARSVASWRSMVGVMIAEGSTASSDPVERALIGQQQVAAAMFAGDIPRARAAIAETRPLIAGAGRAFQDGPLVLDFIEYSLTAHDGDLAGLEAIEARVVAEDGPAGLWAFGFAFYRLRDGRVEEARRLARVAADTLDRNELFGARAVAVAVGATAAAQTGWREEACAALSELSAATRSWVLADLQIAEAEAWLLAGEGDPEAAVRIIASAVDTAAESHYWTFGAITAIVAIRLGRPESVLEFLETAAGVSPAPVVQRTRDLAVALVSGDPERIEAAGHALRAIGFLPEAEGPAIPDRSGLTEREWEVASGAVDARSKDIADQLGLSVRTVETHLQNAYRKLGVSSREELRAALER